MSRKISNGIYVNYFYFMTKVFKKFETIGTTKDEAKNSTEAQGLVMMVDATQSWKKYAEKNVVSEESQKEWMKEYLKKKKYDKAGVGAYIVTQSHSLDTRERPYKVEKPKYDARTHSPEKFYVLRDATGKEVGRKKTSKEAEAAAKEYVVDFKESVTINYEWVSKEKNSLYATVKYTPSKGAQPCKILAFGYVNVD